MKLSDLEISVERITDAEGESKVVVDKALWDEILSLLEDLEDTEELKQARQEDDESIPWEEVKAKYLATHFMEKLETIQYVTDIEGRRQTVIIDLDTWEELLALIENLEEGRERLAAQVNESQQAYEVDQVQRGAVNDFMVEIDKSFSYQQPPRGLTPPPKVVIEPDPQQATANQGAIDLLRSWREGDIEEQSEIWTYLQNALDEDRLSDRPFFP